MLVRIPGETKSSRNVALARCIEVASEHTGVDHYTMAQAMSWFLEALADEVSKGRPVGIPGFGKFFPVPDRRYRASDRVLRCRVRFHPSVGFQQQVKLSAPPQESNAKQWRKYQQNHSAGDNARSHSSRAFVGMQSFRGSIAKQLANARD